MRYALSARWKDGEYVNQRQRREYLIHYLFDETARYHGAEIPEDVAEQLRILCSLFNVRAPFPASKAFLDVQDAYLQQEIRAKGIIDGADLLPTIDRICLWRGDITTLKVDAIVNAANDRMLGCFVPCHNCIDNAIHTYAGIQLRLACDEFMKAQGHPEAIGSAKCTPAYNLPSRYVLHAVGPTVGNELTREKRDQLASCYDSCLDVASETGLESIAFCCISTGVFRFPKREAAEIAISTVRMYLNTHTTTLQKVIFNVYEESDQRIYQELLGLG